MVLDEENAGSGSSGRSSRPEMAGSGEWKSPLLRRTMGLEEKSPEGLPGFSNEWKFEASGSPGSSRSARGNHRSSDDSDMLHFLFEEELEAADRHSPIANMRRRPNLVIATPWVWNGTEWSKESPRGGPTASQVESPTDGPQMGSPTQPHVIQGPSNEIANSWVWDGVRWSRPSLEGSSPRSPRSPQGESRMPPVALNLVHGHGSAARRFNSNATESLPAMPPMSKMRRTGGSMDGERHRG